MEVFVARQPILDLENNVYGYEFLYRDSQKNCYNTDVDGSVATRRLISNLITEFGFEEITAGKLAFLNFTEELILSQYPTYLSRYNVVFEILETIKPTPALLERVEDLRSQGYRFAMDDYIGGGNAFIKHVDVIKVDFRATTRKMQAEIIHNCGGDKIFLAEKIETEEEYIAAQEMGYTLFQGYYFSKPVLVTKNVAQIASPIYWRVWKEANKLYPNFDELVKLIQMDAGLSYQFLASQNVVSVYRGNTVKVLKQAVVNMGLRQLQRKLLLILVKDILVDRKIEIAKQALSRALFGGMLAVEAGYGQFEDDAYVAGLFSMLDTLMGESFENILIDLQINQSTKNALLNRTGFLGEILAFICAYEQANWDEVEVFLSRYPVDRQRLGSLYMKAISCADRSFQVADTAEDEGL